MVCAQPFDSFDESALGAFMESPLGVRAGTSGIRVLVWDENDDEHFGLLGAPADRWSRLHGANHLLDIGIEVDRVQTWTGSLTDYQLIIFVQPSRIPSWWSEFLEWSGRIYIYSNSFSFTGNQAVYDEVLQETTMRLIMPLGSALGQTGRWEVEAAPLVSGLSSLTYPTAFSQIKMRSVEGGTTLITFKARTEIFSNFTRSGVTLSTQTIDVGSHRRSYVVDGFFTFGGSNLLGIWHTRVRDNWASPFAENLYNVPV